MKIISIALGLAIVFTLQVQPAFAWGVLGHRVIGGIADKHLTPKAKSEIQKILGHETLAMASNWADFIKSDRSFDYLGPWHYVNLPADLSDRAVREFLAKDTSVQLFRQLQFVVAQLKNKKLPVEKKRFYLRLLIHLVGDAHQPMHTGRVQDRGGNGIKLFWFNTPTNLHRIWDEQLVEFQQLSYTEHVAAIDTAGPQQIRSWQKEPVAQWFLESYRIAEKLYDGVKPEERLSYRYNYEHANTMNSQLLKGGVRLAGLLNRLFA